MTSSRRTPPRRQPSSARRRPPQRRPPWLWLGLGVVLVVAAIVAVVATRGSDTTTTSAGVEQTRPVQVTGEALPALTGASDPAVGRLMPELQGASFDGTPMSLTRDGRAKLVLFVAHWCPHCQREVPLLSGYLPSHPLPAGVDLVTIATSTNADRPNYPPSAWLAGEDWRFPVLADDDASAAAQAFGLPAFPYFVAVGRDGRVVARTTGEISTDQFTALAVQAAGPT